MKLLKTVLAKYFGNRTASIILPLLATLMLIVPIAWGAIFWWHSTPEYCVMQAAQGLFGHDPRKFNRFVDVVSVVSGFTEEIIHEPADKTPSLTKVQKTFGLGALKSARTVIDNKIVFQLQNIVKYDESRPTLAREPQEDDKAVVVNACGPKSFARALMEELKEEKTRFKEATLRKMLDYSYAHPKLVVSKILIASLTREKGGVKAILNDYGFKKANYKGHTLKRIGRDYICSLKFFSPHINDFVIVDMRLERPFYDQFGPYQITSFVNIKRSFKTLGEDTDGQIQGLIAYSFDGITKDSIAQAAKDVIRDVGQKIDKSEEKDELEELENGGPPMAETKIPAGSAAAATTSSATATTSSSTAAGAGRAPALAESNQSGLEGRD